MMLVSAGVCVSVSCGLFTSVPALALGGRYVIDARTVLGMHLGSPSWCTETTVGPRREKGLECALRDVASFAFGA